MISITRAEINADIKLNQNQVQLHSRRKNEKTIKDYSYLEGSLLKRRNKQKYSPSNGDSRRFKQYNATAPIMEV